MNSTRTPKTRAIALAAAALVMLLMFAVTAEAHAFSWDCPWTAGSTDRVSCAYGCYFHRGKAFFGLDFNWYGPEGKGGRNADCGRLVLATEAGQVRRSSCSGKKADAGYGCHVELLHGRDVRGPRSLYAHLQQQSTLRRGNSVREGGVIGKVGMTGSGAHSCHLHFHMRTNGGRDAMPPEPFHGVRIPGTICAPHLGVHNGDNFISCNR